MPLARILATTAANVQQQVNAAVANADRRIADAVAAEVRTSIDERVTARVEVLDAGRQAHRHEQLAPAVSWYVRHELPFEPAAIDVTTSDGVRWFPLVERPEPNVVVLLFPEPVTGIARLS